MPALPTTHADSLFTFENVISVIDSVLPNGRSSYLARCVHPDHDDNNPSMVINKGRDGSALVICQSRRCEVFKILFDKVRESKANDTFVLREVPKFDPKADDPFRPHDAQKLVATSVEALALAYAYDPFFDDIPLVADFLNSRGISEETAKKLRFGFVPNHRFVAPVSKNGIQEWIEQYSDAVLLPVYFDSKLLGLKLRNIAPSDPKLKWSAMRSKVGRSDFNVLQYGDIITDVSKPLLIFESNFDAAAAISLGANAATIPNAGFSDSELFIRSIEKSKELYSKIIIVGDSDEAGEQAKKRLQKLIGQDCQITRVPSPYKDFGEFRAKGEEEAASWLRSIEMSRTTTSKTPPQPTWRSLFKSYSEMDAGSMKFLVEGFLPEGVTFIGALSASGKTWFALSLAKALTTGSKFLGHFSVPEPVNVLYLVPESGERSFRTRMEKMGITDNPRFLCRTMTDGILKLNDPRFMEAVSDLRPVCFLDTAIRFSEATSENDASENSKGIATGVFDLLTAGAQAIIGVHHSPKRSSGADIQMNLENTLRGSGDLGAMCDAVYALSVKNKETLEVRVENVKARDFEPVPAFHIQGRPFINETQDFGLLIAPGKPAEEAEVDKLMRAIQANLMSTYRDLETATGIAKSRVPRVAKKGGWCKDGDVWVQSEKVLTA